MMQERRELTGFYYPRWEAHRTGHRILMNICNEYMEEKKLFDHSSGRYRTGDHLYCRISEQGRETIYWSMARREQPSCGAVVLQCWCDIDTYTRGRRISHSEWYRIDPFTITTEIKYIELAHPGILAKHSGIFIYFRLSITQAELDRKI